MIRENLQREVGPLSAIQALHTAGFSSGQAIWENLCRGSGQELPDLDDTSFWPNLTEALSKRGWGTLTHRAAHAGVGLLASTDWAEALGASGKQQPSCTFSAGMLSALLTGAGGGSIAVLEVSCRSRGDDACTFAFGSLATVHDLYGLILEGQDLEEALAAL
jgi:hypothetical protein